MLLKFSIYSVNGIFLESVEFCIRVDIFCNKQLQISGLSHSKRLLLTVVTKQFMEMRMEKVGALPHAAHAASQEQPPGLVQQGKQGGPTCPCSAVCYFHLGPMGQSTACPTPLHPVRR